ncbi:MAG: fibronectin type III domain-containing protein [Erysipelotrichaceae bacterium]|nr:MAG: fibronectin type III domain-containing protein [Erysipelotrichaceae bacterium]
MRKSLLVFLLTLSLISGLPYKAVRAIDCIGDRYSVDQIISQTEKLSLGCFALTDYDGAANLLTLSITDPNQDGNLTDALKNVTITYFGDNPNTTTVVETDFSKIVAADRAMAYSQNLVYTNSPTMNIYANSALTTTYTYMDDRNPLYYYSTTRFSGTGNITPSNLSALISVNGAKGYVNVNQIQIIPLIYMDNGWTYNFDIDTGVKSLAVKQAYYIVVEEDKQTINGIKKFKQLKLILNFISTFNSSYEIGLAPDWLPIGTYYSPDGIYFFTDVDLKNPVLNGTSIGKFYNYYAFTNLRSKSNYTGAEINSYLDYYQVVNKQDPNASTMTNTGDIFVNAQNTYGMNALMIFSMGALESGYGRSTYAQNPANFNGLVVKSTTTFEVLPYTVEQYCLIYQSGKYADENNIIHYCNGRYNLFGWGAVDSNPDNAVAFVSILSCINQHMGLNLRRSYMSYTGSVFYASNIGTKGAGLNTKYASDPWWSLGISAIAYRIDRYLGFKDLNSYMLGILSSSASRTVYKDPQLTNILYTLPTRATNYPFIILEGMMVNDKLVYKIQTTNPLNEDGSINNNQDPILVPYNFTRSIAYINADQISDYISKFVTGVVHQGLYNKDRQIFFTNGTATLNGLPILSGATVTADGVYDVVATSVTGIVQTLRFTIDKTAPIISIQDYPTIMTNQNVIVTATTNEGSLGAASYTFTENGTYVFRAVDEAGNITEKSVTISHIDKIPPVITIAPFDSTTTTPSDIIVTASTDEGTLNVTSYTFTYNSSFTFIATDAVGNVSTKEVTVSNIVKNITLSFDTTFVGGTLGATLNEVPIVSGITVNSTDLIDFTVTVTPKYRVYRWGFNDDYTITSATTVRLNYYASSTIVKVEFYLIADLNDDNKVSTTDLVKIRRMLAGLE